MGSKPKTQEAEPAAQAPVRAAVVEPDDIELGSSDSDSSLPASRRKGKRSLTVPSGSTAGISV